VSLSPPEYIRHILDEIDYILNRSSNANHSINMDRETSGALSERNYQRPAFGNSGYVLATFPCFGHVRGFLAGLATGLGSLACNEQS
jgi:hypothetical protein